MPLFKLSLAFFFGGAGPIVVFPNVTIDPGPIRFKAPL